MLNVYRALHICSQPITPNKHDRKPWRMGLFNGGGGGVSQLWEAKEAFSEYDFSLVYSLYMMRLLVHTIEIG